MTRINLNSLSMFDAAAQHGSFRRAAEALHLTQGAVAQHPDISLHIHASETRTDFAKDPVDIAIRQGQVPLVPNTHCEPLTPLDLIAVARPSTNPTSLSLANTVTLPLIEDGHNRW